jgi:protein-tyrosine phosphatase
MPRPFPSEAMYWVMPGRLLAGDHPFSSDAATMRTTLEFLLQSGVSHVFNLTEPHESGPYAPALEALAADQRRSVSLHSFPIADMGVPDREQVRLLLDQLSTALRNDEGAYIHCRAGIGRTATVVGCYLVSQGLTGAQALGRIAALRRQTALAFLRAPETTAQRNFIRSWTEEG